MAEESYTVLGELAKIAHNLHELHAQATVDFAPDMKALLAQIATQLSQPRAPVDFAPDVKDLLAQIVTQLRILAESLQSGGGPQGGAGPQRGGGRQRGGGAQGGGKPTGRY